MNRFAATILLAFVLVSGTIACGGTQSASSTSGGEAPGARMPIRLERDWVAGMRYHLDDSTVRTQRQTVSVNGETVEDEVSRITTRIAAVVSVLEVNASGSRTHLRYQVESLDTDDGTGSRSLVDPGSTIEVWPAPAGADARILVDGQPIADELRQAIETVLTQRVSDDDDDDASFGTTTPRLVGESWSIDADVFAAQLAANTPFHAGASAIRGQGTLRARRTVDGHDGQVVGVGVTAEGARLEGLPPGMLVRDSRLRIELEGFFPDDIALPSLDSTTHMTYTLVTEVQGENVRPVVQLEIDVLGTNAVRLLP